MLYGIITILSVFLIFSVYKNVVIGMAVLRMEDAIEDCLDVIDEKYSKMTEILQRPLFFDSVEVKTVVNDIKAVRSSLHDVAVTLARNITESEEESGEEEST
jgi:hypothetical protein